MVLQKTSKEFLTSDDILKYISDYEINVIPHLNELWEYYKGKNSKIVNRKAPDSNSPDNKIVVSYGRKLISTYTGYGWRPRYINYKINVKNNESNKENTIEKKYLTELQDNYDLNNEHIKTNRAGRNMGLFGLSYEILYVDSDPEKKIVPRFFTVDPRELVLLYDFNPEPKIKYGIRFYKMESPNEYKVEVYYKDHIDTYIRKRKDENNKWILIVDKQNIPHYFSDIPIVSFYSGDEIQSIMENVLSLIDAYDVLFSDSMNEFDRFAFAYLIMKRYGLTNPIDKKDPVKAASVLQLLKRRRVFENLDKDADIKFLTKDIPTDFIKHIGKELHDQIHTQSHIPDFNQMTGALSGSAIDRLLFDFENLVSSSEADFDVGLIRRGELITIFLRDVTKSIPKESNMASMIMINHKRNKPTNVKEFADTALTMQSAGFSRRAIVSLMPEDIIPDIEKELEYEKEEQEYMLGDGLNDEIDDELN